MQLTVRDVSKMLKVSEREVYRWIEEEELPAYRVQHQYRFNRAELLEWATSHQIPFKPGLFSRGPAASVTPSLSQSLESGGIFYGVKGLDKPSVLRAIVQALPLPPTTDREHLFQMVLARETLASTGIGNGIAVPHVRNPVIFPVREPLVTLFFLEKPVGFGALDGQPVHSLFTLVSPTVRTHLQLLSRLAFALRHAAFQELIQKRAGKEEILKILRSIESSFPSANEPC